VMTSAVSTLNPSPLWRGKQAQYFMGQALRT
jgi:hypothetical protein